MEKLQSIIIIIFFIIGIAEGIYKFVKGKKIKQILNDIQSIAGKFFILAEKKFLTNLNDERMSWVEEQVYKIIPDKYKNYITKQMIRTAIQFVFDKMADEINSLSQKDGTVASNITTDTSSQSVTQ